jgi:hypothetical protein
MRPFSSLISIALFTLASQINLGSAEPATAPSVRDEAAGIDASLAKPATGAPVLDPGTEDYAFLEESLLYQVAQQKDWKLRLFASGVVRYDTNIFLAENGAQKDTMWSFRPGFQYSHGETDSKLQLQTEYSMQMNQFQRFMEQNSLNHFLSQTLVLRMKKTTISFLGTFNKVSGGDVDVGGQAQRIHFTPSLQVSYDATEKIRLGLSSQLQHTNYDALLSSTTYRVGAFADYAFNPKLRLGLQVNQMIQEVQGSGTHHGQDYLARVEWEAFNKVFLNGSFGVQHFRSAQGQQSILPVGQLGLRYALGPKTSLNLSLNSRSQNSPSLTGQYFQSTGLMLGLQQQLGTKVNIGADFGCENADYRSYSAGTPSSRQDNIFYVRPWVKYTLHRHLSLDLFYQHTVNDSKGNAGRSFQRDLFGLGLTASW